MITIITCFFGRHEKVERILRYFLDQDYTHEVTLLLYNNARYSQLLDKIQLPDNKHIILINNWKDLKTGEEYKNVGVIFRDALTFVPENTEIISFMDSDDIFLPNHISEGVSNYLLAKSNNYLAYKPYYSYFLYGNNKIELAHNNMEPSIFVSYDYVKYMGFFPVAASYHQKWLNPLQIEYRLYEPKEGKPTFIYDWSEGHNTHKISGLGDFEDNFRQHRTFETDHGDGVLTPAQHYEVEKYYKLINQL